MKVSLKEENEPSGNKYQTSSLQQAFRKLQTLLSNPSNNALISAP